MKVLDWLSVLLTVLFVALKLTHVIAWGWLAVLSPVLVMLALALLIVIGGAFYVAT